VIEFLRANWLSLAILAGILVIFVVFRNRATRISGLDQILGQGQPVIVEVFSNA